MTGIPLAGVIGAPIAHSRSPQLHGYWLQTLGIKGFYVPMQVAPADLENALQTMPKLGFVGTNVTIPHKETVLHLADTVSDRARAIGAANTLSFSEGKIHADNTDAYGFLTNLTEGAADWRADAGPAVVLGAGGAARAVLVALIETGVPKIILSNRTKSRAEQLKAEFGPSIHVVDWGEIADAMSDARLLVNTTSLGMTGQPELEMSLDKLSRSAVVTDLVYTPLETALLQAAREKGCRVVDGLGMLLHQGVPGFERWFGAKPKVDDALRKAVLA
jgi:shikimate dehydrogenase